MTKPANLEYAFAGFWSGLGHDGYVLYAYRIINTPYVNPDPTLVELDVAVLPGFDYSGTAGDGDGSPGQYALFLVAPGNGPVVATSVGFDPSDPANHKPTTVRYWELQPGSDVMATTLDVLPRIFTYENGAENYAGLVTLDRPVTADEANGNAGWYVTPASTPVTQEGFEAAAGFTVNAGDPAGPYLAWYGPPVGGPPPLAFPAGWTPGNTTGSGPVLPKVAVDSETGASYYAGLVVVAEGAPAPDNHSWYTMPPGTTDVLNGPGFTPWYNTEPGVHMGVFGPAEGDAPTALPAGWTFRPYGLGPVAITDENAGGVIGDVAYVVSGYVYNDRDAFAIASGRYIGHLGVGTHTVAVGDVFTYTASSNPGAMVVTVAGELIVDEAGIAGGTGDFTEYEHDYAWPFLERYNLKTKTWLPRIKLPSPMPTAADVPAYDPTHQYAAGAGSWRGYNGLVYINLTDSLGAQPDVSPDDWRLLTEADVPPYAAEGGFAGVINGKLYFGGGDGDNISGNEFFVFDPATGEFTRLPDVPGTVPLDYSPYGVVGGRFYGFRDGISIFEDSTAGVLVYDPSTGWSAVDVLGVGEPANVGDQVQGVEIGGKLYFVYDRVYVFDPVALTVEAKAAASLQGLPTAAYAVGGKIRVDGFSSGTFSSGPPDFTLWSALYDSAADAWTEVDAFNTVIATYNLGVVYKGVPYSLSGNQPISEHSDNVAGVYGLTGNAPTYEAPPVKKLNHTGLPWRLSCALQTEGGSDSLEELLRAGMSPRQAKTWLRGDHSMKALLRGGFTRNQAKLLKEI